MPRLSIMVLVSVAACSGRALGQDAASQSSPLLGAQSPDATPITTSPPKEVEEQAVDGVGKTVTAEQASTKAVADSSDEEAPADQKAGRLMRSGFTVGLAAAAHVSFSTSNSKPAGVAASAMPYVAIFPAYWSRGDITRTYCASRFLAEDDPQAAANAYAIKKAISQAPLSDQAKIIRACTPKVEKNEFTIASLGEQQEGGSCDPSSIELNESSECKDWVCKYTGWQLGVAGRCSWTWLGTYVGLPFAFSANNNVGGLNIAREYTPVGSFGLVFAPSSYAVVLVGISFANVLRHPMEEKASRAVVVPTFTAGIGGNLDIAAAFFPK